MCTVVGIVVPRTNGVRLTSRLLFYASWVYVTVWLTLPSVLSRISSRIPLSVQPGGVSLQLLPRYFVTIGRLPLTCDNALGAT